MAKTKFPTIVSLYFYWMRQVRPKIETDSQQLFPARMRDEEASKRVLNYQRPNLSTTTTKATVAEMAATTRGRASMSFPCLSSSHFGALSSCSTSG
jgi:hypothetical protein